MSKPNDVSYRVARSHSLTTALPLFRPIKRGARKSGYSLIYRGGADGEQFVQIYVWRELDIADQDLMLAILAIAKDTSRSKEVGPSPITEYGVRARDLLELAGDFAARRSVISISTTARELIRESGRQPSKSFKWFKDSIERLSMLGLRYSPGHGGLSKFSFFGSHLPTVNDPDDQTLDSEIEISINPLVSGAILGEIKGYTDIDRQERHQLSGRAEEIAKALHYTLCQLVDLGQSRTLSFDMLVDRIYTLTGCEVQDSAPSCLAKQPRTAGQSEPPPPPPLPPKADGLSGTDLRDKRRTVREALHRLASLETWAVTISGRSGEEKVLVARGTPEQTTQRTVRIAAQAAAAKYARPGKTPTNSGAKA